MNLKEVMGILKKLGPIDTILIGGALLSLFILISSNQDKFLNFVELIINLEWYWYVAFLIVAAIRPAIHLMRIRSQKTQTKKKKNLK
tara:strand:- start:431 stop:691 length:261 start_codon:yes stop_codon:yes gene_type:complete